MWPLGQTNHKPCGPLRHHHAVPYKAWSAVLLCTTSHHPVPMQLHFWARSEKRDRERKMQRNRQSKRETDVAQLLGKLRGESRVWGWDLCPDLTFSAAAIRHPTGMRHTHTLIWLSPSLFLSSLIMTMLLTITAPPFVICALLEPISPIWLLLPG